MAFVIAADDNEVLAAAEAQKKVSSQEVKEYAKMLQTEHAKNQKMVMTLGEKMKATPADTKAVDQLRVKGAETLAGLVPLEGKEFEKAYMDAMVKDHQEVLTMIDGKLLPAAKDDALKKQLMETKKHVSMHLDQAKMIQAKL